MAELNVNDQSGSKKKQFKKHSTKMDMTPMVDLAFLLLTFFMLTAIFSKPLALELNMPDSKGDTDRWDPKTVTILIDEDQKLYYYQGEFDAKNRSSLHPSGFYTNGIRHDLIDLNQKLVNVVSKLETQLQNGVITEEEYKTQLDKEMHNRDNNGIRVIIKPTDNASYESVVSLIDEMKICNIVNYALVDITIEEERLLAGL